jgi:hypothetical protein
MEGTLVFVHGTGVRSGYQGTMDRLNEHTAGRSTWNAVKIVACPWGNEVGIKPDRDRVLAAIPGESRSAQVPDISTMPPGELSVAVWSLLLDDPLFELRLAAVKFGSPNSPAVDTPPQEGPTVDDMLRQLRQQVPDLTGTGVTDEEFRDAVDEVQSSVDGPGALTLNPAALSTTDTQYLAGMVARAVVATILAKHKFDEIGTAPIVAVNAMERDNLVTRVASILVPAITPAIFWPTDEELLRFALARLTEFVRGRREAIAKSGMVLSVGDIFHYLRRGDEISDYMRRDDRVSMSDYVARCLQKATPPVVAVGHSLGGIILVDILSRKDHPRVDRLVTIGSQAPALFVLDALEQLRPGSSGIRPFTPWLNIYDLNDLLSFCAKRPFGDSNEIEDVEIASGVPFPLAHGAYFERPELYDEIEARWPKA